MSNNFHRVPGVAAAFTQLLFPPVCPGCKEALVVREEVLCLSCKLKAGRTNHFIVPDNELTDRLKGRVSILHGAALFHFIKDGIIQHVIHGLKYERKYRIGLSLGQLAGRRILHSPYFGKPEVIVPVPISRSRLLKRGYNQAELFARGIARCTGGRVESRALSKKGTRSSQTSKSRADRFINVLDSFQLRDMPYLHGKCVLLVDDVLTTGATLEAACTKLIQIPGIRIQILVIALAHD